MQLLFDGIICFQETLFIAWGSNLWWKETSFLSKWHDIQRKSHATLNELYWMSEECYALQYRLMSRFDIVKLQTMAMEYFAVVMILSYRMFYTLALVGVSFFVSKTFPADFLTSSLFLTLLFLVLNISIWFSLIHSNSCHNCTITNHKLFSTFTFTLLLSWS